MSISEKGDLYDFYLSKKLIDSIAVLNPGLDKDLTYVYDNKRVYYICVSPTLAKSALKGCHQQFNQHFISDYKGAYLQSLASKP